MTVDEVTPCPKCGTESSESYDGSGMCWPCFSANLEPSAGDDPVVVEAIPDDVDGLQVARDLLNVNRTYVRWPSEHHAHTIVLWQLHTWCFDAIRVSPFLRFTSAAPGSGKTAALEVLVQTCQLGRHIIGPSGAALHQIIDKFHPTLLLDEIDNFPIEDRRDVLAVLNAGNKRGVTVPRGGKDGTPKDYDCFCPKAFAGLDDGKLPDTLLSRSITFRMEPSPPNDQPEWFMPDEGDPDLGPLRENCKAWAFHHIPAIRGRRFSKQELQALGLHNRPAQIWVALLAVADELGGPWPERARAAARELGAGGDDVDAIPPQVQLLIDIRAAFGSENKITTSDLLEALNALEESPWGARRRGEGMDARGLAGMLRSFKIKPRTVRVDQKLVKGYHLDQFEEAFAQHLPSHVPEDATQATQATHLNPQGAKDVSDVSDVSDVRVHATDDEEEWWIPEDERRARALERDDDDVPGGLPGDRLADGHMFGRRSS